LAAATDAAVSGNLEIDFNTKR